MHHLPWIFFVKIRISEVNFCHMFLFVLKVIQEFSITRFFYKQRFIFLSIKVFFYKHSRFTGQQGKGKAISLIPLYHFHLLHRHLDISRAITAESSPLHIVSSRNRTGNLWFPSTSR